MRIGFFVQGDMDEAVVRGLAERWCPGAELAEGRFRGSARESLRREVRKALLDLKDSKACDALVVLTDADANRWQEVKRGEWEKVPEDCRHLTLFGVADRNVECWLAADRGALAAELGCRAEEIPTDDPSAFVKRRFGLTDREGKDAAKERVREYVVRASLKSWIEESDSFADFHDEARRLAKQTKCPIPNERNDGVRRAGRVGSSAG